jgi:hypothetical protein
VPCSQTFTTRASQVGDPEAPSALLAPSGAMDADHNRMRIAVPRNRFVHFTHPMKVKKKILLWTLDLCAGRISTAFPVGQIYSLLAESSSASA